MYVYWYQGKGNMDATKGGKGMDEEQYGQYLQETGGDVEVNDFEWLHEEQGQ